MTTTLNKAETAVLSVFTLIPVRVFKDKVQLGRLPSPGPTEPLRFFEPGGTIEADGLRITLTYSDATEPKLQPGDDIIGFFVKDDATNLFRYTGLGAGSNAKNWF